MSVYFLGMSAHSLCSRWNLTTGRGGQIRTCVLEYATKTKSADDIQLNPDPITRGLKMSRFALAPSVSLVGLFTKKHSRALKSVVTNRPAKPAGSQFTSASGRRFQSVWPPLPEAVCTKTQSRAVKKRNKTVVYHSGAVLSSNMLRCHDSSFSSK